MIIKKVQDPGNSQYDIVYFYKGSKKYEILKRNLSKSLAYALKNNLKKSGSYNNGVLSVVLSGSVK